MTHLVLPGRRVVFGQVAHGGQHRRPAAVALLAAERPVRQPRQPEQRQQRDEQHDRPRRPRCRRSRGGSRRRSGSRRGRVSGASPRRCRWSSGPPRGGMVSCPCPTRSAVRPNGVGLPAGSVTDVTIVDGETFQSLDPATGEPVGTFPVHSEADVRAAVDAGPAGGARGGRGSGSPAGPSGSAPGGPGSPAGSRELAELIHREGGKPVDDAMIELATAIEHLHWAAAQRRAGARPAPGPARPARRPTWPRRWSTSRTGWSA